MILILFTLLALSWTIPAVLITRTIDDQHGDSFSGQKPTYIPDSSWNAGPHCATCSLRPEASKTFGGTWMDVTRYGTKETASVHLNFVGVAIQVFCIIPPEDPKEIRSYNVTFTLDGGERKPFAPGPNLQSTDYLYNVSAFAALNLTNTSHTLVMETVEGTHSIALFDWAEYTFDDGNSTTNTRNPTTNTRNPTTDTNTSSTTSTSANAHVGLHPGYIAIAVLLPLLVIALVGSLIIIYRHRCNSRAREPDDHEHVEVFPFHSSPITGSTEAARTGRQKTPANTLATSTTENVRVADNITISSRGPPPEYRW